MYVKNILLGLIALLAVSCNAVTKKEYHDPEKLWGELYQEVFAAKLFTNQKEFWDAIPKEKAEHLLEFYETEKAKPGFDLKKFIRENFTVPNYSDAYPTSDAPFETYVRQEFDKLLTRPKDDGGSLVPTRMRYLTGGGMFQEYNYFRSFFAVKAFQALKEDSLASNMATNCFQFVQDYGYVPYANRSYYLGFTDVPVLSLMAQAVAEKEPTYLPWFGNLLGRDYQVWMGLGEDTDGQSDAHKTSVLLEKDKTLNRYFNDKAGNAYISLLKTTGWEGSSRFLVNGKSAVSDFIPVDLNALLFMHETMLSASFEAKGRKEYSQSYTNLGNIRKEVYNQFLYNKEKAFYYDYDFVRKQSSDAETLAAIYPLLVGLATPEQVNGVVAKIEKQFLTQNGLVNDLSQDFGSAEMNYLSILALRKVGKNDLANDLKNRWINLNREYFRTHKHILPVYNMRSPELSPKNAVRIDGAFSVLIALLNE